MARFYFDFHDGCGILRDDAGEELHSATFAWEEALKSVGQAIKALTYRPSEGRVVIEVRDSDGPVLRVSAVVETTPLKGRALPRGIVVLLAGINEAAVDRATADLAASGDLLRSSTAIRTVSVTRNRHIELISVHGLFAFLAKSSLRGAARAQSSCRR